MSALDTQPVAQGRLEHCPDRRGPAGPAPGRRTLAINDSTARGSAERPDVHRVFHPAFAGASRRGHDLPL